MNVTRWKLLQEIVSEASELPLAERDPYLDLRCAEDAALRQQAGGLIAAYGDSGSIFEKVVGGAAARAAQGGDQVEGDSIGPYRITGVIGHGGMGTVYCAQRSDKQFRQSVAIKLVRTGPGANEELFARFRAERQMLANINHPNIARLLDGGITDSGLPYLVMEFVEGLTLDRYLAAHTPNIADRLALFRQICAAIQHAHQNLIVHRDLKPNNIMVTPEGTPKLLDFGIAKLLTPDPSFTTVIYTRPAERLMTPEYASPEQIRGGPITTATDIHGLGILLYEMLTGSRPFKIANLSYIEVEKLICDTQPLPPSLVGLRSERTALSSKQTDLDRIVLKALHKVPERRYASAADLSADVERYLHGFPVTARPDSFAYRATKFVGRNSVAVTVAVLFLATIIGLSINLAVQRNRARQEAASADAVSQFLVGLFNFTRPDATQGRSVNARELLDQGTENLDSQWNGTLAVKARLLNTLGSVYYQIGDLDRAQSLLTQAETIYGSQPDTNTSSLAETANTLGMLLIDKGDYQHSFEQFDKAFKIYVAKEGRNSSDVTDVLNGLGTLQWTQGNFEAAEKYQHEAIAIDTHLHGPEASETLMDKGNLEVILADRGDYKAAEPLVREVLAGRRRLYGDYNTNTASTLHNLAFILERLGRFEEAERAFQETLKIRRKLYGVEHPEIANGLVSLGWLYRELGRLEQARELTEEGLAMAAKLEGQQSLDTAFNEDALGLVFLDSGDLPKARAHVETALRIRLSKPHPPEPALSQSYDHLGLIDLAEGNEAAGLEQIRRALEIRQKFYKAENDWVATSFNHLGKALLASGELEGARDAYGTALRIARQNFGDGPHPITAEALYGAGNVLSAQHQLSAAKADLTASLNMRQALYGDGNADFVVTPFAAQAHKAPGTASR